ncbi:FHA domain-containing protein [Trinickia violacea]|uniref:FHA domain-containing protein n=1 Tax=Trinickia violacea TaxID=2571746 RepID=A0A4P8IQL8_9BURK|nr:FHA domain-containing protein [Trinickia violacea]QCP49925.1 FHA domain-containing protein [Trinickia violacea]
MSPDDVPIAEMQTPLARRVDIVLRPISHPEFGEIRIESDLFAVGRAETPFASARAEVVAELSRRHARIFFEHGVAYIADLDSKNGTTVNGVEVRQKPHPLHNGDEIRFASVLAYRVELMPCVAPPAPQSIVVTLTPERDDLDLQPIVITGFPFLISKADDTFARYKGTYPHQVNYVSRRHAHIFLRDGDVFVEDLGSTNGTFVGGKRLDESALALRDGETLAFGGNHFVYRAEVRRGPVADPTVTKMKAGGESTERSAEAKAEPSAQPAQPAIDPERTTFVGTAHSFLDIFCVDPALKQEDEVNPDASQAQALKHEAKPRHRRTGDRFTRFVSELSEALGGSGELDLRRWGRWGGAALAALGVLVMALYVRNAPQRDIHALLDAGRYASATETADRYLARHPGDAAFQAAGTEALMKAMVPEWLAAVKAQEFDRAHSIVAGMKTLAQHNADAQPLVAEIGWMGDLEAYWAARGGAEAPIRLFKDEPVISSLVERWNDDPDPNQHALDRIASFVPEFAASYGDTLSHLRKLESDDSVYGAAAERLKTAIDKALSDDRLESLPALLDDYSERYPRLTGFDSVRSDLRQYQQIESDARAGNTQAVAAELKQLRFATPPFQARVAKLEKLATSSSASHGAGASAEASSSADTASHETGDGHDARPSP